MKDFVVAAVRDAAQRAIEQAEVIRLSGTSSRLAPLDATLMSLRFRIVKHLVCFPGRCHASRQIGAHACLMHASVRFGTDEGVSTAADWLDPDPVAAHAPSTPAGPRSCHV